MSSASGSPNLTVGQVAERFQRELIPLTQKFGYFAVGQTLAEEELKDYLEEPVAALPPQIVKALPKIGVMLVPYIQRGNAREGSRGDIIALSKPSDNRAAPSSEIIGSDFATLVFAIEDYEVADYHYHFYNSIAALFADRRKESDREAYNGLLREELSAAVNGEVDEDSWRLKQALQRRQSTVRRDTKVFREYAQQSFVDTLTLYLHGICCDIDVDTGPRQLPSRFLRRRLSLLHGQYPPPSGYAVFPEDLKDK